MEGPRIEAALADGLASRGDEVARRLENGDPCGARAAADTMRNDLIAAINDGRLPEAYLEDLTAAVNELAEGIPPCEPPDDGDEGEDGGKGEGNGNGNGNGNGKGKGKGKDKGRDKEDD